jgi:hypothetical protein
VAEVCIRDALADIGRLIKPLYLIAILCEYAALLHG